MERGTRLVKRGPKSVFEVCHAAAINIGGTEHARDAAEYCPQWHLQLQKYLEDMGRIWISIFVAMCDPMGSPKLEFWRSGSEMSWKLVPR